MPQWKKRCRKNEKNTYKHRGRGGGAGGGKKRGAVIITYKNSSMLNYRRQAAMTLYRAGRRPPRRPLLPLPHVVRWAAACS